MKTLGLSLVAAALIAGACSNSDSPTSQPTQVPTIALTPIDDVGDEIRSEMLDIARLTLVASQWGGWAASIQAGVSAGPLNPDTFCADVREDGFEGLAFNSIWPSEYLALDKAVGTFCAVWKNEAPHDSTNQRAFAILIEDRVAPLFGAVENDQLFDIENMLRERAALRDSTP